MVYKFGTIHRNSADSEPIEFMDKSAKFRPKMQIRQSEFCRSAESLNAAMPCTTIRLHELATGGQ
jgi:hypothetical protein